MKITGRRSSTIFGPAGIYNLRVEAFQDNRFILMFICKNPDGKDIKWVPLDVIKGTKVLDLDKDIWPCIEDTFKRAL